VKFTPKAVSPLEEDLRQAVAQMGTFPANVGEVLT
jgi:hypothetical protein